jgi:hypothetical protein
MKDFLGQELHVSDIIVFSNSSSSLQKKEIIEVSETWIKTKPLTGWRASHSFNPKQAGKITRQDSCLKLEQLTKDEYGYIVVWLVWGCKINIDNKPEFSLRSICLSPEVAERYKLTLQHEDPAQTITIEQRQTEHLYEATMLSVVESMFRKHEGD